MKILELKECTDAQFVELKCLMAELTERVVLTPEAVENVLKDANCHLFVMVDCLASGDLSEGEGRIIGCTTLCVFHSPTGRKASVEDVIEQARALAPIELMLTSNPKRVAANKLYQSLGFQRKETNCYQMSIAEGSNAVDNHENLKQSITYLIGKELAEGNLEPITPLFVSRMLNVPLEDVEKCLKEMGV